MINDVTNLLNSARSIAPLPSPGPVAKKPSRAIHPLPSPGPEKYPDPDWLPGGATVVRYA